MTTALQAAGATEQSAFAPLHVNRMLTGLWTNSNPLRDASTSEWVEKMYGGRQDRIAAGLNCEITARQTLKRRPGLSVYNALTFPPINRFYPFNTFTLTEESIRVIADTANVVYDATGKNPDGTGTDTQTPIWNKSAGAGPSFFLGVGNILYFTNGVENKQWIYDPSTGTGQTANWGIVAPTTAPSASFSFGIRYGSWQANMVYSRNNAYAPILIIDSNNNVQLISTYGNTGTDQPQWDTRPFYGTQDGTAAWENVGNGTWVPNTATNFNKIVWQQATDGRTYFYQSQNSGTSSQHPFPWMPGIGSVTEDNGINWLNLGQIMYWQQVQNSPLSTDYMIEDANGNVQTCIQAGRTGQAAPSFNAIAQSLTSDPSGNAVGAVIWRNSGMVGAVQYGYAYMNSKTGDISNMSPASTTVVAHDGVSIVVYGPGSSDPQADTIVLYRTLHNGSTFFYLAQFPNPGAGQTWVYNDTVLDANLNITWEAQVTGEGTPLPPGATCLEYHVGRIWAGVGNVVYASSGPDAAASNSSGMAGFNTTFTCQSKITRLWASAPGLVVFTVRDVYLITGDGAPAANGGKAFIIVRWIDNLPLLSYDAFTVNLTLAVLFTGNKQVMALDPAAGITEISFPVANLIADGYDPAKSYLTYHTGITGESALFISDGTGKWLRLSTVTAPDTVQTWNPPAFITGGNSAVQSCETLPGRRMLLVGPSGSSGPIRERDTNVFTDTGTPYIMETFFGSIILAVPGQLAGLAWITIEGSSAGSAPAVSVLMNELSGDFEPVPRSRQDPPNLPPSKTIISDRHYLLQGQSPIWCRHLRMGLVWPAEDAPNELFAYTIFGQMWQELRSGQ